MTPNQATANSSDPAIAPLPDSVQLEAHAVDSELPIVSVEKAQRMAAFFATLSDPNRWRIISALALKTMRVRDIAQAVNMSESAVSHQLRVLRAMRLVRYQKQGRSVVYALKDHHILNLYQDVSEHLDETDTMDEADPLA